jgi:hypothetical protein
VTPALTRSLVRYDLSFSQMIRRQKDAMAY